MQLTIPSQVGGLNTRDAYDQMAVSDCIQIKNIYPKSTYCISRGGTDPVGSFPPSESLNEFYGVNPTSLVGGDGKLFTLDGTELDSGFASDRWNGFYYKERTFLINGADTPQVYDGTALAPWGFTGVVVGDKITNGFVSKDRCWFTYYNDVSGETGAYYGAIGNISGSLDKLVLNFIQGGECIAGGNWSQDSGVGLDDMTYFLGSNGDVKVYTGNNFAPATDDLFRLIEQYSIPKPIGRKCNVSVGGDVIVITQGGIIPLSRYLSPDKANAVPVSDKINRLITDLSNFFGSYGWEIKYFKKMGALWISCPDGNCYVMNVVDKSTDGSNPWTVFDINANALSVTDDTLYFTNANGLYEYGGRGGDSGMPIECESLQASTDLGSPEVKQFLGIKPIYESRGEINYSIKCLVDFDPQARYYTSFNQIEEGTPWDSAPWNTFPWYAGATIKQRPRKIKAATGRRVAFGVRFDTKEQVKILSNDILYIMGSTWK